MDDESDEFMEEHEVPGERRSESEVERSVRYVGEKQEVDSRYKVNDNEKNDRYS